MSPDDLPRLDEHADLSQTNRNPAEAAHEDGHGRSATRPSDIPARGWMDILWRVYQSISDDRILMNAAGVTFYALLALFPAIDPDDITRLTQSIDYVLERVQH